MFALQTTTAMEPSRRYKAYTILTLKKHTILKYKQQIDHHQQQYYIQIHPK